MKFIVKDFRVSTIETISSNPDCEGGDPKSIYNFYQTEVAVEADYELEKEHVVIICVTTRMKICGWHLVSIGTLNEAHIHPREVFRPVIVRGAYGFVLCHNHPSGDPSPSPSDLKQTKRLSDASEILGIKLIDHVVIGAPAPGRQPYYSFREAGYL